MPVDHNFQYTDTETIQATVRSVNILGFDGDNFTLEIRGKKATASGSVNADYRESIESQDADGNIIDLDGNGTGDLIDALNQAKAQLGLTITNGQFRDLILLTAQKAVTNKAQNS